MREEDSMDKEFEKETRELENKVMNYVHDSLDGKITQGKPMLWAMQRFINDLKRTNQPDCEWYFDWYELMKFNRWCGMAKHSKGVLAGKSIEPHVSWLFEFANILGFKYKKTGFFRFREAFIFQSRKQGKTQKMALLSTYKTFLGDEQQEVYLAGWNREQSMLAYDEIEYQIGRMPILEGKYSDSYHHIRVNSNGSTIKALSREAKKTGDGSNPSLAIIDEYANSHETNEIVDVLKSGMVSRQSPLTVYITTAGFNLNYPAYSYYNYCKDIINPETNVHNDDIFVAIYELDEGDDIKDESVWAKANPVLTTYEVGMNSLRSGLQIALDRPEEMRNFLTKNMNMWVDMADDGFIELSKWNKQEYEDDVSEFLNGASMYYGIDLSATTDLTSIGWVAVKGGKFLVGQRSYMPADKYKERMSRDKIRFDLFYERDELVLTDGSVVDYNYLRQDLLDMASEYGCKEVGFDVWNAVYLSNELKNDGLTMVEIPQTITQLTEPTKRFREKLYDGSLYHTGDTLLRWAISNAITQQDHNENIKISKSKSKDRIDPVDAILNAFARAMYDDQTVDLNSWIMSDDWSM